MSCSSPFEIEVSSDELYESSILFSGSGSYTIPGLTIPATKICDDLVTTGGLKKCIWTIPVYTTTKKCGWGCDTTGSGWNVKTKCCKTCACTTSKTLKQASWLQCTWSPLVTKCDGWMEVAAIPVFAPTVLTMTAQVPLVISASTEYIVDDLGLNPVQILDYTIYQTYDIEGVGEKTFKLTFGMDGYTFDFYLPTGFSLTMTECNGDFSATIPLFDFGTFPPYTSVLTGYKYTLTMNINLLFCLGDENWLKLQIISSTTISGGYIPLPSTQTLPMNLTFPIVGPP